MIYLNIITLVLFIFTEANSQNNSGFVEYSLNTNPLSELKEPKDPNQKYIMEAMFANEKIAIIKVNFNNGYSKSSFSNKGDFEPNNFGISYIRASSDGVYCFDWSSRFINNIRELDSKTYNISSELSENIKWNLTNETRKIDNWNCLKATAYQIRNNPAVNDTLLIEAWYTPEISLPIGPARFVGLPGLVIELKEKATTYKINRIAYSSSSPKSISCDHTSAINISSKDFKALEEKLNEKFLRELKYYRDRN